MAADTDLRADYATASERLLLATRALLATQPEDRHAVRWHVNTARQALQTLVMCAEAAALREAKETSDDNV